MFRNNFNKFDLNFLVVVKVDLPVSLGSQVVAKSMPKLFEIQNISNQFGFSKNDLDVRLERLRLEMNNDESRINDNRCSSVMVLNSGSRNPSANKLCRSSSYIDNLRQSNCTNNEAIPLEDIALN